MTFKTIVEIIAGLNLNHPRQLQGIAGAPSAA